MEDHELDATALFKQDADQLTTVRDLPDALSRFGFSSDDKISRRELVNIFNQIKHAMEPEIFRLANNTYYTEAKEMRNRLTSLRQAFDQLQLSGASGIRDEQQTLFGRASQEVLRNTNTLHRNEVDQQCESFHAATRKHELFHEIEKANLEQRISLIPHPHTRYSKRLIELFKSEYNLNKLKSYDEAIKVRRMINKLLPDEEQQFHERFQQSIEKKRTKLAEHQQEDDRRFDEKLKSIEWTNLRRRERELITYAPSLCPIPNPSNPLQVSAAHSEPLDGHEPLALHGEQAARGDDRQALCPLAAPHRIRVHFLRPAGAAAAGQRQGQEDRQEGLRRVAGGAP